MSDQRPYPRTEWETEQKNEVDVAVGHADEAVVNAEDAVVNAETAVGNAEHAVKNADRSALHVEASMKDIMESSREIAANSKAVETLTRDALILDNKRFRRRNAVLVFLTSALLIGMGYMIYRDLYISAPQRNRIAEQTEDLQDANTKLDEINAFIDEIQADSGNDDGDRVTREDLQPVFDAVFETRAMVECVITAPNEDAARNCAPTTP